MSMQVIQGAYCDAGVVNPVSWTPLCVGNVVGWFAADAGVTITSDRVSAWENQVSGVTATQGTAGNRPVIDTVFGRDWVRFEGDGLTANVGHWLTTTEAALLSPMQFTGSPASASFYLLLTCQAMSEANTGHTLISGGDHSESSNFTEVSLNTVDRQVRFLGASPGNNALMHPVVSEDTDVHVVEVVKNGFDQTLRVDGVVTESETAGTVGAQSAFDILILGATARLSGYYTPANARLRDVILVNGVPSESEQHYLREGAKVRAGL